MDKSNFAFNKINYIICGISLFIIILGFFLMTGSASTIENGFDPDIFSPRRIVVAPMTCFFGFLLMIVGILFSAKKDKSLDETTQKTETVQQK